MASEPPLRGEPRTLRRLGDVSRSLAIGDRRVGEAHAVRSLGLALPRRPIGRAAWVSPTLRVVAGARRGEPSGAWFARRAESHAFDRTTRRAGFSPPFDLGGGGLKPALRRLPALARLRYPLAMNVRFQTAVAAAQSSLTDAEQDGLADLIEGFLMGADDSDLVSPEELEELRRIEAGPDDLADPAEVAAVLRRRG